MPLITNQFTTAAEFPTVWEETPDGFLRVKARPLKEGVMPYMRHELSELPPELDGVEPIYMLVGMDALSSGETLRSLEGARVTAPDHIWVSTDNAAEVSKGSAAGKACIAGQYQEVDLLITDPETIEKVKSRELGELSSAYHAESVYAPGTWNGQEFHLLQTNLIYNHIAVLPPGTGRAGVDVRIINKKPETKDNEGGITMIRIKLANTGKFVNVDEETASALEAEQTAAEAKVGEEKVTSGKKVDELISQVEELNAEIAKLQAEADESKGELSVYKEKLDELLSEEAIEHQAMEMAAESADADEIIENAAACMEDEKKAEEFKNGFERLGNTGLHKLRGSELQSTVLNAIGMNVENMSPGEIKGAFRVHHQMAIANRSKRVENKKSVAGAALFQNKDEKGVSQILQNRVSKMWGGKKQ